jgi:hypothetical protein
MPLEDMWNVTRGVTGSWGIQGYEAPKSYVDPIK